MNKFKQGDRVTIYNWKGPHRATVDAVEGDLLSINHSMFHYKQCRKLVLKPRREFWLVRDKGFIDFEVREILPENKSWDEVVHVKEVRGK